MLQEYQTVRLPKKFLMEIKKESDRNMRSLPKHLEFLARLGQAVRDNPDLPPGFVKDLLEAKDEIQAGAELTPFEFRNV